MYIGRIPEKQALLRRRLAAMTALIFIPLFSILFYYKTGRPDLADMPLAQRRAASLESADFSSLIARMEMQLQKNGEDAQGWLILAGNYRLAGRLEDAVKAYNKVVALKGEDSVVMLELGETMVEAESGVITPDAQKVFAKVLLKEKTNPEARFYIARGKAQKNDKTGALKDLHALLSESRKDAPWRVIVEKEIQMLQGQKNNER